MNKSSRQELKDNIINYDNNNNVVITISRHIQNRLFRDFQQYPAMIRHIEGHSGIFRYY